MALHAQLPEMSQTLALRIPDTTHLPVPKEFKSFIHTLLNIPKTKVPEQRKQYASYLLFMVPRPPFLSDRQI